MQELEVLERRIVRAAGKAVADFGLVEGGDRILVACSGGKDSWTLLHVLEALRRRAPVAFDLVAVNLDQGQPGYPAEAVRRHLEAVGVPHRMVRREHWREVERLVPRGKTACSVCARLRRAVLYDVAVELGCSKIALGHHRDDLVETLLLNALYCGALKAMPALLRADDGRNTVIRPLCYVAEEDIAAFAEAMRFPVVPCGDCATQPTMRRRRVKALLAELSAEHPRVKQSLLAALGHVVPSHLLDRELSARLAPGAGRDPWLDGGEEEDAPGPPAPRSPP
jgi:tRNA 2-thiocytidine biosynthesis protein TtcA